MVSYGSKGKKAVYFRKSPQILVETQAGQKQSEIRKGKIRHMGFDLASANAHKH